MLGPHFRLETIAEVICTWLCKDLNRKKVVDRVAREHAVLYTAWLALTYCLICHCIRR